MVFLNAMQATRVKAAFCGLQYARNLRCVMDRVLTSTPDRDMVGKRPKESILALCAAPAIWRKRAANPYHSRVRLAPRGPFTKAFP